MRIAQNLHRRIGGFRNRRKHRCGPRLAIVERERNVNILSVEYVVVLVWLFTVGTVFGSMLNVCIYRLPREERFWKALRFMVYPPSHCPRCRERIRFYDNIPILGWVRLGGRCR